jgi:hypothetical protein
MKEDKEEKDGLTTDDAGAEWTVSVEGTATSVARRGFGGRHGMAVMRAL